MGVVPRAIAMNMAMIRPRIKGSVESCNTLFAVVVKVWTDIPTPIRSNPKSQWVGITAARAQPNPKQRALAAKRAIRGFVRPAASSAPATDPIYRHQRSQKAELMCTGVEDGDRHGGNEDRKVESKSADPKNHEKDRF
jgi:hypothetical protein